MVKGDGGLVETMDTQNPLCGRGFLLAGNDETRDLERRTEVISPGTSGVFWEVRVSFPASVRILWDKPQGTRP